MDNLKKLRKQIIIDCLIFLLMVILPPLVLILFKIPIPLSWFPYFCLLLLVNGLIFGLLSYFHIRELRRIKAKGKT